VLESDVRGALRPDEPPVRGWRAVEAQHVVSTQRLISADSADPAAEQDLLERILDEAKPPLAPGTEALHYLLATPFRYPPSPWDSRFRGPQDPGILYAALTRRTACAEMGYWRWRFVQASDGLRGLAAAPQTVFQVGTNGPAVRLDEPPLSRHAVDWTRPDNYTATQALGRLARSAGAARIFYTSVRDSEGGTCIAVLDPAALKPRKPVAQETWYLTIAQTAVIWQRERDRYVFNFD
jgi:hypothetical protein